MHFGINPNDLQNSTIAFDYLHSRLSSNWGILSFIWKYLEGYGYNSNESFLKYWGKLWASIMFNIMKQGKVLHAYTDKKSIIL